MWTVPIAADTLCARSDEPSDRLGLLESVVAVTTADMHVTAERLWLIYKQVDQLVYGLISVCCG